MFVTKCYVRWRTYRKIKQHTHNKIMTSAIKSGCAETLVKFCELEKYETTCLICDCHVDGN